MFRIKIIVILLCVVMASVLGGCLDTNSSTATVTDNGSGTDSDVVDSPTNVVDGTTTISASNAELLDLGDLVNSQTNTWWYTRAEDVSDDGFVVGQTNAGSPARAAFIWNPENEEISYIGKHDGNYNDYYLLSSLNDSGSSFVYSQAVSIVSIEDQQVVLGNSTTATGWPNEQQKRAFLYEYGLSSDSFIDLPPPSYLNSSGTRVVDDFSEAVQINKQGEVIITADGEFGRQAYYWDGQTLNDVILPRTNDSELEIAEPDYMLLTPNVNQQTEAVAINENNQVVINTDNTAIFVDLYDNATAELNFFPGESSTTAVDLNDSGHVVGVSGGEGFFWRGGSMISLGHLGGESSQAVDVNNNDQVVGFSTRSNGTTHAILWSLKDGRGELIDLGTLGGSNSYATAINDAGQVIGYSETGETYTEGGQTINVVHGFLWDAGYLFDLGSHDDFYSYPFDNSYPLSEAVALSETGHIAGNSKSINNHSRGFYTLPDVQEMILGDQTYDLQEYFPLTVGSSWDRITYEDGEDPVDGQERILDELRNIDGVAYNQLAWFDDRTELDDATLLRHDDQYLYYAGSYQFVDDGEDVMGLYLISPSIKLPRFVSVGDSYSFDAVWSDPSGNELSVIFVFSIAEHIDSVTLRDGSTYSDCLIIDRTTTYTMETDQEKHWWCKGIGEVKSQYDGETDELESYFIAD